ncbi:hypothetical protein F5Y16DRAFT_355964 [Xylariaceae sp. FL0255]|nr:hypothetical protein F5Y16DRAFT_355964 [Xylariaceae sp. FL0255]
MVAGKLVTPDIGMRVPYQAYAMTQPFSRDKSYLGASKAHNLKYQLALHLRLAAGRDRNTSRPELVLKYPAELPCRRNFFETSLNLLRISNKSCNQFCHSGVYKPLYIDDISSPYSTVAEQFVILADHYVNGVRVIGAAEYTCASLRVLGGLSSSISANVSAYSWVVHVGQRSRDTYTPHKQHCAYKRDEHMEAIKRLDLHGTAQIPQLEVVKPH